MSALCRAFFFSLDRIFSSSTFLGFNHITHINHTDNPVPLCFATVESKTNVNSLSDNLVSCNHTLVIWLI